MASRLDVEAFYGKLPIPLQHAVCSAEGRRLEKQRYGRGYESFLASAKRRGSASLDEMSAYRWTTWGLRRVPMGR